MGDQVDVQAFRRDLFSLLDTIADGGAQFRFGLDELLCMWFDDHWYHPEGHVADGILSEQEFRILTAFSETFRTAYPKFSLDEDFDLEKLQSNPKWLTVVRAAQEAQAGIRDLKDRRST